MRFEKLKNDILGKDYELSLAYVTPSKSREINKKYRKKDKPTNVLSFSLRQNEGELVLCKEVIKKEAKDLKEKFTQRLVFLVIHGMLHLKGMQHSSKMEKAERFYFKKYDQEHFSGNRLGNFYNQSSGGRVHPRRKKS